jgi:hypothetical protein
MIGSRLVDRRKFLRLGVVAGVIVAGGCGGDDTPTQVTSPPVKRGNIDKLQKMDKNKVGTASDKK